MRAISMRGWMMAGAAAVVIGSVTAWVARNGAMHPAAADEPSSTSAAGGWNNMLDARTGATAAAPTSPSKTLTPEQVRTRLFKEGSFAGTEPAGDWCIAVDKLKPCPELRKRFEYYILGVGEVTIADIRTLVADEAERAHGPRLAAEIMSIWDKYWQLRTHDWRNKFVQSDRSTWMPVFDEQRMVRRDILGADWAKAFFEEDEEHFKKYYAQLESGEPPQPDPGEPVPQMAPGKDPAAVHAERVARYGEAAAQRLAKADEEWADWERRLAAARTEWDRLKTAANLSDLQRKQEMQTYIQSNFKSDEHRRVEALLHL